MMLLAASPGGTTANLFSHLFRGDVALNITLTAINSVVAAFTLPLVVGLAIAWFEPAGIGEEVGLQFGKVLQVFAIVLVPVLLGMLTRRSAESVRRSDGPAGEDPLDLRADRGHRRHDRLRAGQRRWTTSVTSDRSRWPSAC